MKAFLYKHGTITNRKKQGCNIMDVTRLGWSCTGFVVAWKQKKQNNTDIVPELNLKPKAAIALKILTNTPGSLD